MHLTAGGIECHRGKSLKNLKLRFDLCLNCMCFNRKNAVAIIKRVTSIVLPILILCYKFTKALCKRFKSKAIQYSLFLIVYYGTLLAISASFQM